MVSEKFVLSLSSEFPSGRSLVKLSSREAEGSISGIFFYSAEPRVFPIWPLNFTFSVISKPVPTQM